MKGLDCLHLPHVFAQRLRRQPQISRDVRDRTTRLKHQPRRTLQLGTTDLSFHQADPGSEVSVKPGWLKSTLGAVIVGPYPKWSRMCH
jgi:hypothetical protein